MSENPTANPMAVPEACLQGHMGRFANPRGNHLLDRTEAFFEWQDLRREHGVWPYSRRLEHSVSPTMRIRDDRGRLSEGINFASQDYLSLGTHPEVRRAAQNVLDLLGPHSAGSPVLLGNTPSSEQLEADLASVFGMEHVVLFPTGWGAGFGTCAALVRPRDHIVMDSLSHACLQQGAYASTLNVVRHAHLDVDAAREALRTIRSSDARNGILVVTEGLFSMDSDFPTLRPLQEACREFGAVLLVDVAHDFGSLGPGGTGQIGMQDLLGEVDLVMGAFSKTFASNGGFLAVKTRAVKEFVKVYGGPHTFSNAISPIQTAIVSKTLEIVRSEEGGGLRDKLMAVVLALRGRFAEHGIECFGAPSAIVPVHVGNEKVARIASRLLTDRGVLANLVEYPAVPVGSARFRMQAMAGHTEEQAVVAADTVAVAIEEARTIVKSRAFEGEADDQSI